MPERGATGLQCTCTCSLPAEVTGHVHRQSSVTHGLVSEHPRGTFAPQRISEDEEEELDTAQTEPGVAPSRSRVHPAGAPDQLRDRRNRLPGNAQAGHRESDDGAFQPSGALQSYKNSKNARGEANEADDAEGLSFTTREPGRDPRGDPSATRQPRRTGPNGKARAAAAFVDGAGHDALRDSPSAATGAGQDRIGHHVADGGVWSDGDGGERDDGDEFAYDKLGRPISRGGKKLAELTEAQMTALDFTEQERIETRRIQAEMRQRRQDRSARAGTAASAHSFAASEISNDNDDDDDDDDDGSVAERGGSARRALQRSRQYNFSQPKASVIQDFPPAAAEPFLWARADTHTRAQLLAA